MNDILCRELASLLKMTSRKQYLQTEETDFSESTKQFYFYGNIIDIFKIMSA